MTRPMPRDAPVTSATLPSSFMMMSLLLSCLSIATELRGEHRSRFLNERYRIDVSHGPPPLLRPRRRPRPGRRGVLGQRLRAHVDRRPDQGHGDRRAVALRRLRRQGAAVRRGRRALPGRGRRRCRPAAAGARRDGARGGRRDARRRGLRLHAPRPAARLLRALRAAAGRAARARRGAAARPDRARRQGRRPAQGHRRDRADRVLRRGHQRHVGARPRRRERGRSCGRSRRPRCGPGPPRTEPDRKADRPHAARVPWGVRSCPPSPPSAPRRRTGSPARSKGRRRCRSRRGRRSPRASTS